MPLTDQQESRLDAEPDADKLDSPTQLASRSWRYVVRRTWREFMSDECTDLAAALTYYAVLALFPAAIALISLLGLVGQGDDAVDEVLCDHRRPGRGLDRRAASRTHPDDAEPSRSPPGWRWSSVSRARCGRPAGTSVRSVAP